MMRLIRFVFIAVLFISTLSLCGQDTWYGTVSGMQMMHNPGFTGVRGRPFLNLSVFSFLPGNGFGLRSVYASYDTYAEVLQGGAGLWVMDDMLGDIMNDLRGGAAYAYHFRAGRDLYVSAGLTASVISRGIRSGSVILPDNIDPFRGVTGLGTIYSYTGPVTRFDLGAGLTVFSERWYTGASLMHLTAPDLGGHEAATARLGRLLTLNGGASFNPGRGGVELLPSAAFMMQGSEYRILLGNEISWKSIMAALSIWHLKQGFSAVNLSAGYRHSLAIFTLSYSYIIDGGDAAFGGTALVKAGVIIGFGNVEKSRAGNIIKLPLL